MTFAFNLLLETRPPVLAQADPNAKVALAQILKVRTIRLAFMPNEWRVNNYLDKWRTP